MVEKDRTLLLNAYVKCPKSIEMELWIFAFCQVVHRWNDTPIFDLAYKTPDNICNGLKRQIDARKHHVVSM